MGRQMPVCSDTAELMRLFDLIRTLLACATPFCLATPAAAKPRAPAARDASTLCGAAIAAAQRGGTLPPRLLAAIGLVESGRRDPRSGVWAPWPWTIDAAGQPAFFDSKAEAVAAVRALQARGVQSIDVGCMQVNLAQHPRAFASLEQAFDPAANVRYAVQFLGALFERSKAWPTAAGLYHSATPGLGAAYQRRVMAAWPDGARFAAGATPITGPSPLARAWAATLTGGSDLPVMLIRRRPNSNAGRSTLAALTR